MKRARVRVKDTIAELTFSEVAGEGVAEADYLFAGRYRIDRELSQGGMGRVYLAEQVALGRTCVIKVPKDTVDQGAEDTVRARFLREASLLARVQHPHVVTVYDHGEDATGVCFLAMEFLAGQTLDALIKSEIFLSPERAAHVALQIASALREAHRMDVLHRDLKPANVFITRSDTDEDYVKVLDFGLARTMSEVDGPEITQRGALVCTPWYSAPEQVTGAALTPATDVYALGALLCEMLTGSVPFNEPTAIGALKAHLARPVPALRALNASVMVGVALENFVRRCLEKEPGRRPSNMANFARELRDAMEADRTPTLVDAPRESAPTGVVPTRETPGLVPSSRSTGPKLVKLRVAARAAAPVAVVANSSAEVSVDGGTMPPQSFSIRPSRPSRTLTWWAVSTALIAGMAFAVGQFTHAHPSRASSPHPATLSMSPPDVTLLAQTAPPPQRATEGVFEALATGARSAQPRRERALLREGGSVAIQGGPSVRAHHASRLPAGYRDAY